MKREHKCCCLCGKAVAITYSRVNEQHPEVPFYCFVFSHYFSYGAGILSIPTQTLNILLLRKVFYIALYSVFK